MKDALRFSRGEAPALRPFVLARSVFALLVMSVSAFAQTTNPPAQPSDWEHPSGPYAVVMEEDATLPDHTVYRPERLDGFPRKDRLPIVAFSGPGCDFNGTAFRPFFTEVASHGFLVVANGPPEPRGGSGPGFPRTAASAHLASVNWAVAENGRRDSQYLPADRHVEDRRDGAVVRRAPDARHLAGLPLHDARPLEQRRAERPQHCPLAADNQQGSPQDACACRSRISSARPTWPIRTRQMTSSALRRCRSSGAASISPATRTRAPSAKRTSERLPARQVIERCHSYGIKIMGATSTPDEGIPTASSAREAIRQAANRWIGRRVDFDAVVDFDAAVRDRERPARLRQEFDSGDHIHPNDAGNQAMADAFNLDLFKK